MTWDDFDALPTFSGGHPGKSAYRKMTVEAGGVEGVKRVDRFDPDGTQYILNTRDGMPRVITIPAPQKPDEETLVRGYIAHAHTAKVAARFSPYSLAVHDPKYRVFEHKYTVMDFATKYNVVEGDETKWHDVVSFYKGVVLVNGKAMPALATTSVPGDALPWLIKHDVERPYADAATNATEKRVFSISRVKVRSWAPGGVEAVLSGADQRAENKALSVGPRIDRETNTAHLAQLSFSGFSWDDENSSWAFNSTSVAMLLTAPYLEKMEALYGVDQSVCAPIAQPASIGSSVTPASLPSAEVALIGRGEVHMTAIPDIRVDVWWPWSAAYTTSLIGETAVSYSSLVFTNSISNEVRSGGRPVSVFASNTKEFRSNTETKRSIAQTVDLPPSGTQYMGANLSATGNGTFFWLGGAAASPSGARGINSFTAASNSIPGSASYKTEDQSASFAITVEGQSLVSISFSRLKEYGTHVQPIPVTGRYSSYLSNPYGLIGSGEGLGFYSGISISCDYTAASDPKEDERAALLASKAGEWAAVPLYDHSAYDTGPYYTSSLSPIHTDDQSLNWSTRDFILYDAPNGVFVSIDATFSGSQSYGDFGKATLTVVLRCETPLGIVAKTLMERTYLYAELLEEQEVRPGLKLVPSVQLRPMFVPFYQEQGDFRGAAYTTAAEVAAGVEPAYLFNFVLMLDTFNAIGGEIPDNPIVSFIPCHLLEMLYAFVFSTKYGVGELRYPVDYGPRYKELMTLLFGKPHRVCYRDGVFVDWLDTIGDKYVTEETTELYRV